MSHRFTRGSMHSGRLATNVRALALPDLFPSGFMLIHQQPNQASRTDTLDTAAQLPQTRCSHHLSSLWLAS